MLLPLGPRPGVETSLAAREVQLMERNARRHARAAVRDDLPGGHVRQRLLPRRVQRTGDAPEDAVDRVLLAAPPEREARVDDHDRIETRGQLVMLDRVVRARLRDER